MTATRLAARLHRLSGVGLAVFLPLHFWALGQALGGAASLDAFLDWSRAPLVKVSEIGIVLLLALHLTGGLRLLAVEFLPWRDGQRNLAVGAAAAAAAVALIFALGLV